MDGVLAGDNVGDGAAGFLAGGLGRLGGGGGLVFDHYCGSLAMAMWEESEDC